MSYKVFIIVLITGALLAACGQKGPLTPRETYAN